MFRAILSVIKRGNEIDQLVHDMAQLRMEWTDTLDQLRAREERLRKRERAKLREAVDSDVPEQPPAEAAFAGGGKDEIRAMARQRRLLR